jgi:hypothetical protein
MFCTTKSIVFSVYPVLAPKRMMGMLRKLKKLDAPMTDDSKRTDIATGSSGVERGLTGMPCFTCVFSLRPGTNELREERHS